MNAINKNEYVLDLTNETKTVRFTARWDGCCHLELYCNGSTYESEDADRDYMHVCDLDEHIKMLQELSAKAKEHFGKNWPNT